MKQPVFTGAAVAIITPMHADGTVNFEELGRIIDDQIAHGTDAIVICGTTGESAALSHEEHVECIRFAVKHTAKRVPVIAGTGSNDTAFAIEISKEAEEAGADALLVVTPYYNKATQNGLIRHFTTVADASTVPVIVYNVPTRTAVNILPRTAAALAEHPNIVGIKEASGNMAQMVEMAALCGDRLHIYSGEDALTVPMMAMGAKGTISVLSNVVPREAVAMTDACLKGDFGAAAAWQCRLLPLINALFSEVNPIPAKAAVSAMGFGEDFLRLPLTPMEEPARQKLYAEMRKLGVRV